MSFATILLMFLMIVVFLILLIYGAMEKEWFPLYTYALGLLLCFSIITSIDETSQSVAEKYNIDYALVEAIAEVTDESEYDVAVTLSVAGTENIKVVFNLTDEEMTAIEVLTREE